MTQGLTFELLLEMEIDLKGIPGEAEAVLGQGNSLRKENKSRALKCHE